uniref:Ovule protein n=1 Tax=Meloidogyne javanica TaxID=6303 RepID=A0A915LS91_MELJA
MDLSLIGKIWVWQDMNGQDMHFCPCWQDMEFFPYWQDMAPPISHLRIFVGAWRPLRRYNCVVDRGGQEVNYIVDYFKDEESMLKVQQKGWKLSNFVDRMWIRYFRFKRNFLDR